MATFIKVQHPHKSMVQPGDTVKITCEDEVLEGILLHKPELLGTDVTVLKTESGYNMGIKNDRIKKIDIISEKKDTKTKDLEMPNNPKLPKVMIMSTGGTISSKVDYTTGGVKAAYTATDFVNMCPELADLANIEAKKVAEMMSEDMHPSDWSFIVSEVEKVIDEVDGLVITCGTDTLGYIAAALSFAIRPNKPIIITASQRSIDRGSSDAFLNLICAVNAAANWKGNEIAVCLHGTPADTYCDLIPAAKVRKMHTSRRDAFRPINTSALAKVYGAEKIEILQDIIQRDKTEIENGFSDEVALIFIHPGMNETFVNNLSAYKGIILMGTGLGHIPGSLYKAFKALVDKGIFVGMTSQCLYGRTSPTVYSALRRINLEVGITFLSDMLAETAFTKLCWLLDKETDIAIISKLMQENMVGEINVHHTFEHYLN